MSKKRIRPDFSISVKRRKTLTLKLKHDVVRDFESGMKTSEISRKWNLHYSTVSSIVKDKERILEAFNRDQSLNSSLIRKRHGIIAQMESLLKVWCEEEMKDRHLNQNDICNKAREIFEKMKKEVGGDGEKDTFVASNGWYRRFKKRCDWTVSAQNDAGSSTTTEIPFSFPNNLTNMINEGGYSPQTVFNVKDSRLFWNRIPKTNPNVESPEDLLTVMLGGNASGDCKLKPLLVYHNDNPKALKNKTKSGLPVIWKSHPKSMLTASIFEDWFGHHFIPEVERYCLSRNIPFKVMLILEESPGHPRATLMDFDPRVKVVFLPPDAISLYQPMDQDVIKTFRRYYTRRFFSHLTDAMILHPRFEKVWKDFNLLDSIRIIGESWSEISTRTLATAWGKLCPHFLRENSLSIDSGINDIVALGKQMNLGLREEDIHELLSSHDDEAPLEDFIKTEPQNDDSQPEKLMTVEQLTQGLNFIESGIRIFEEIDSNEERVMTVRQDIQRSIAFYVEILREKTSACYSSFQLVQPSKK